MSFTAAVWTNCSKTISFTACVYLWIWLMIVYATMSCTPFVLVGYLDLMSNLQYLHIRCHIVSDMLYCLICLSFLKYRFDGFRSLLMCSQLYIFISEITIIPTPFSKISYRFHFRWKNMKVVEFFTDHFRLFSSLRQSDPRAYGMMERRTSRVTPRVSPHCWQ